MQDHHLEVFSNCSKGPICLSDSFKYKPKKLGNLFYCNCIMQQSSTFEKDFLGLELSFSSLAVPSCILEKLFGFLTLYVLCDPN